MTSKDEEGPIAYIADMSDFRSDPENMNLHTQRGQAMVTQSQQKRGYARPAFAAKDGTVLGGNLSTMEVAADIGLGKGKVFVVETDGKIPIIHRRTDIESGSEKAVLLAAEDNHSAVVSINLDPEMLAIHKERGIDFGGIFTEKEEVDILAASGGDDQKSDGSLLSLLDVSIGEPRHEVEQGQVWRIGDHVLICCDVLTEWQLWLPYLNADDVMFAPYPGVFVPLSLKADEYKMVMVQPDPYIAGHILDRYEDVKGAKSISRE